MGVKSRSKKSRKNRVMLAEDAQLKGIVAEHLIRWMLTIEVIGDYKEVKRTCGHLMPPGWWFEMDKLVPTSRGGHVAGDKAESWWVGSLDLVMRDPYWRDVYAVYEAKAKAIRRLQRLSEGDVEQEDALMAHDEPSCEPSPEPMRADPPSATQAA